MEDAAAEFDSYVPAGEDFAWEEEDLVESFPTLTLDEKDPLPDEKQQTETLIISTDGLDIDVDVPSVSAVSKLHIDEWLEITAPTTTIELLRGTNACFVCLVSSLVFNILCFCAALRVRVDHMIRLKFAFANDPEREINDRLCQVCLS